MSVCLYVCMYVCIEAKDGTIIMEQKQILHRWQEYIKDLFADNRGEKENVQKKGGNPVMKEEIIKALKNMAVGKATGPDEIPIEMVSALEDCGIDRLIKQYKNIKMVYNHTIGKPIT